MERKKRCEVWNSIFFSFFIKKVKESAISSIYITLCSYLFLNIMLVILAMGIFGDFLY